MRNASEGDGVSLVPPAVGSEARARGEEGVFMVEKEVNKKRPSSLGKDGANIMRARTVLSSYEDDDESGDGNLLMHDGKKIVR